MVEGAKKVPGKILKKEPQRRRERIACSEPDIFGPAEGELPPEQAN